VAKIEVRSEIAGKVWQIAAPVGQRVGADDPVVVLESMKMEIPVVAPRAGTVAEILVAEGETVQEDQVVALLEG